jgi:hypothetical protein
MDCVTRRRRLLRVVLIVLVASATWSASAQTRPPVYVEPDAAAGPTGSTRPLVFSGEVGTFGELYSMSGIEARRPSSTGRLYLRSTLTAWNSFSVGLNMMLSTEGNSARQDINQLDFNPRWRWGQAHLGDFSEEFTPLTLGGIRVRGGGLLLTPGMWNVSLISGLTKRPVSSSDNNRSYERQITGGRLGIGRDGGTGFNLYIVSARDKLSSLAEASSTDTTFDSTFSDIDQNPASVNPQENLVVSTVTNIVALDRKLRWRTEIGASALTRDRRSEEPDDTDVPDFLKRIYTPRISSGADYAYTTDLSFDIAKTTVNAGYHYIGPGYVSLGVGSLMADKREITGGILARHRGGMVKIDGALQSDNLIDQKSYTTDRARLSALISHRLRPRWNATVAIIYTGMGNSAADSTRRVDFTSWVMRTGHYFSFGRSLGLKSLSFDYTYQTSGDQSPLRANSDLNSHSTSLSGTVALRRNVETVATASLITTKVGGRERVLTQNYSVSMRHLGLNGKLTSSAALAVGVGDVTTTLRPSLKSSYPLGRDLTLSAEMESTHLRGGDKASRFNEIVGRLILTRRF